MKVQLLELMEALDHQKKIFSINFSKPNTKSCLSLHYNGVNSYLFVNGRKFFKFQSDNKNFNFPIHFCIRSIYNGFSALDSRGVSLNGNVYELLVDYNSINKSSILNIKKYLMIKKVYKLFGINKKMFVLLSSIVNAVSNTKYVSLSNQKCEIQSTLINLHPYEYSQEFHYYSFSVKLDRYVGSWNTLMDLSNKICIPNKIEDLNLTVFNMITGINESKTLTKHISYECKCRFDGIKNNSNQ